MQQQPRCSNNICAERSFSHYSGMRDPQCAGGATGCLVGCYYGKPVEGCFVGCLIGCIYRCFMTTDIRQRVVVNSIPIPSPNHIHRD